MSARGLPQFAEHAAKFLDAQRAGVFRAQCVHVVDGDTYDVILDLGFRQYALVTLRLLGVDTAELSSRVDAERVAARAARDRANELLLGRSILVRSYKDRQTFGRYVAEIWLAAPPDHAGADDLRLGMGDQVSVWRALADILIAEGLGEVSNQ